MNIFSRFSRMRSLREGHSSRRAIRKSHRVLVEEIEKLLNVFQGLRLTNPELLDGYIKNADWSSGHVWTDLSEA